MRELHVIALSEDGRSIVLATSKDAGTGGFRLSVDARLLAAVRGNLPRPGEDAVRDSALTPKDIQMRLRAGESPEKIAAEAGVPVARVERFAGPVASEFQLIINQVRAGFVVRGRRGPSVLPLGAAVELHLANTPSLRPESVTWSTRREDEGTWIVVLGFVARARARTASWRYDPKTRSVTPVDAESAAFGHVEDEQVAHQRAARAAKRVVGKPVAKAGAKPFVAKAKPIKHVPTTRSAAAPLKRASAKRVPPASDPAVTSRAVSKPAVSKPVASKPAVTQAAAASDPTVTPTVTQTLTQTGLRSVPARASRRDGEASKGRPSVPAWADVLLGTSPRPDRDPDD